MAKEFWWKDSHGERHGPIGEEEIAALISSGAISPETPLFASGMPDWRMAGGIERFASLFASGPAASVAPSSLSPVPQPLPDMTAGHLSADLPVWGFLGRSLLMALGLLLIVPAPWTSTAYYRWIFDKVSLPNGERFAFSGRAGDIWFVFLAYGALIWIDEIRYGSLIALVASWYLNIRLMRWCAQKLNSQTGRVKIAFEGGFFAYAGWSLLLAASVLTIVGWAWVVKYMYRWLCRNTRGTVVFDFDATGLAILWRTLAFIALSVFVIPIPWALRWYVAWMISRIAIAPASA